MQVARNVGFILGNYTENVNITDYFIVFRKLLKDMPVMTKKKIEDDHILEKKQRGMPQIRI